MNNGETIQFQQSPEKKCTRLSTSVWLPRPIGEVFDFFADASNLEAITPPWLRFRIVTPQPITMTAGTLVDYRLRLHFIPIRWRTEISLWEPPFRFVDRQLRGPYQHWHHTHTFEEREGGTQVTDEVDFRARGGRLVERYFVQNDLRKIFRYRHDQLLKLMG